MFERFTEASRLVLVQAQQEARDLDHDYIGTEHLLLGLVDVEEAGEALASAGVTKPPLLEQIESTIAPPITFGSRGSPPFTPRAKRVLELSLRERLQRGGGDIGPGDLLLGLLREGHGVGVQALVALGIDPERVRQDVLDRLARRPPEPPGQRSRAPTPVGMTVTQSTRPSFGGAIGFNRQPGSCALCGRDLWEVSHFVAGGGIAVCQICVEDAAELIQSAPAEAHRLALPPRVFGASPGPGAPSEIADAVAHVVGPERPDEDVDAYLEDAQALLLPRMQARERTPAGRTKGLVRRIRFVSNDEAWVELVVQFGEGPGGFPFEGPVRRIDGRWKVTRELLGTMLGRIGIELPPAR